MALSKRHFKALARIAGTIEDDATRYSVTTQLIQFCAAENPAFSPSKFREAVEEEAESFSRAFDGVQR